MNRSRALWVVMLLLLLAFCCCMALLIGIVVARNASWGTNWFSLSPTERADTVTQVLQAQAPVTLTIDVPVGDVRIRGGDVGQINIRATKRAWGRNSADAQRVLDGIDVQIVQDGDQVRITGTGLTWADGSSGAPRSPRLDLEISAPTQTTLRVTSSVGRVEAANLQGDVSITADVGSVMLSEVAPAKTLSVDSRVASIRFSGPLVPGAAYRLTSDIGRIALHLPEDSTFSLDARSDIGNISLGFSLQGRSSRDSVIGKEVTGAVGADPTARLIVRSRLGDIAIQPKQ